ncbi:MAG TPA: cyclodeaminase/cyclohydrolase family protein [Candidatus Enterocloster faecavium]|uniref:Cyclodeaminase/cyclohydrolase family protein n=1 Tax=Candidatus Enterocloster faecavium TaxID=2838560 RepID=A0A9D2RM50_9FIRM|nr:cyclodeaminase/cyclohydrolase family protein [Candidatus Enterocloster faecavium]
MVEEMKIGSFAEALSSKAPIPGGGGASALAGALGSALGQMVGNLTVGKKKYAAVEEEVRARMEELSRLSGEFLRLADRDEEVFKPLAEAYGLPKETKEEREYKEAVMEERLLAATMVPLEIMERAVQTMEILEILAEKGSVMAVSDVGVGIQFARTALLGGVMNVYINTKSMKDRQKAEELNGRAGELTAKGIKLADQVYGRVLEGLKN